MEPPSRIPAMRPVPVEEHLDVPDAEQRPFVLLGRKTWVWAAALLLLGAGSTYLALTYAWAVPALIVGAPVLAVVVGSLMTWRHHRRNR
ncbi:hypothetical protein [Oerskovia jenensis]|uniref:hypothetical protein n=1 Tax=Oerskovia jenensis TaxID=162169 RepID=UPI0036DEA774